MSDIQPQLLTLDNLLYGRLFKIPEYQRSYSWRKKQRDDLFEDIERTWELNGNRYHFMATVVGLQRGEETILTKEHQVIEIVDGQQRITTLILLLKAISKFLHETAGESERIVTDLDELLVKPDNASVLLLQTNHDTSQYFANYLRTGLHPSAVSAKTLADREILLAIDECEEFVESWSTGNGRTPQDLLSFVKNRIKFVFYEIGDEALVYTVFEVLNSRGLDVSWFDRLKSLLMAIVFEAESGNKNAILNEIHSIWTDIYRCVGLRLGLSTESLRFAATLQQAEKQNRILGEEKATYVLKEQSSVGMREVIETSKWLKEVTEAVNSLAADRRRNSVTRIVQARFVATAIHLSKDLTSEEKDKILRRWEKVTFRIYGMFGFDARTAVGDYVRLGWSVIREKPSAEKILGELSRISKKFPLEKAIEKMRGADCYNGWYRELRYFFYRYEEHLAQEAGQDFNNQEWNLIWTARASDSIEHILPQSTGNFDYIHSIGNLVMLPPKLNSQLGAKSPLEKKEAYNATGLKVAQQVTKHMNEWDEEAIKKREAEILAWAQEEWAD